MRDSLIAFSNTFLFPILKRRHSLSRKYFSIISKLEGGDFFSPSIRYLMRQHYGISVDEYSYGPFLRPGFLPQGIRVGRYVSMAFAAQVTLGSKPLNNITMHPLFSERDSQGRKTHETPCLSLTIDHDAWIGHGAMILPKCGRVGIGAVIGAGAVVTRDVEDFEIVAGNPAKRLRFRFEPDIRERILTTRWWEKAHNELFNLPEMYVEANSTTLARLAP